MEQNQGQPVVENAQGAAVDGYQGDHQHLERDDHGGNHQREGQGADPPAGIAHHNKGRHGGHQNGQHGGAGGDNGGVQTTGMTTFCPAWC